METIAKFTLTKDDIKYIFSSCKTAVSQMDRREQLQCLHFACKNSVLTVQSTDGFRLHSISFPITVDEGSDFDFLIKTFSLPKLNSIVVITIFEKEVEFDFLSRKFVEKRVLGDFLDVSKSIPTTNKVFSIGFNAKLLTDSLKSINGKSSARTPVILEFYGEHLPCIIKNQDKENDFRLVLPLRINKS